MKIFWINKNHNKNNIAHPHYIVYKANHYCINKQQQESKLKQIKNLHRKDGINITNGLFLQIKGLLIFKQKHKIIFKSNIFKNNIGKSINNITI